MAITITMLFLFTMTTLASWIFNMMAWWELVLFGFTSVGIYLYKKKDMQYWNSFLLLGTMLFGSRLFLGPVIVSNYNVIELPISFEQDTTKMLSGLLMTVMLLGRFVLDTAYCIIKKCNLIKSAESYEKLIHMKEIKNLSNFYTCSTFAIGGCLVVTIFAYKLQDYMMNMGGFAFCVLLVYFCEFLIQVDCTRRKKEEFLEEYKAQKAKRVNNYDTAEVIDLESDDYEVN